MALPNWQTLELATGIRAEPIGDPNRVVFWVPDLSVRTNQRWRRVTAQIPAHFEIEQGFHVIRADAVSTARPNWLALRKLMRWVRGASEATTWFLPSGEATEQCGDRRTDLLIVWVDDDAGELDERRIKAQWPHCQEIGVLARNLFLVTGVDVSDTAKTSQGVPPAITAPAFARRLLAEARERGDPSGEAAALVDLGIVLQRDGNATEAVTVLDKALALTQPLGDQAKMLDILSNLGTALLASRQASRALEVFLAEQKRAKESGSKFAMRVALGHLGRAYATMGDTRRAIAHFGAAIDLARELGDRQGQVDLHWELAILQAEQGQRDQAIKHGQGAVKLLEAMDSPVAGTYAEHLAKYCDDALAISLVEGNRGRVADEDLASSPGVLRMALTVAKAMTKFVGSGLKTVSGEIYHDRMKTCQNCEYFTGVRCKVCGCFSQIKARLPHERCPLEKW